MNIEDAVVKMVLKDKVLHGLVIDKLREALQEVNLQPSVQAVLDELLANVFESDAVFEAAQTEVHMWLVQQLQAKLGK